MNQPSQVESILHGALEKPPGDERSAYLDAACGGSPELREEVNRLLAAHPKAVDFLEKPASGATAHHVPSSEYVGNIIAGRYKLIEKIGEGGMGEVWVAEQTAPVRRKVALKLIKAGMDSKSVLARFEAERQALAVMDHPNIAKVLDGGLTEQGRPYFVMEYVKGVPITEYCDATRLSVQERLGLFTQVCQAVQHAHQKGIIHRDLKPSNILVAPYDDKPVPKVIDFGLAKAMHHSLTERTLHTAHDIVLGTPLYMSPEQAQLNNLDVDTRSDIYSLGVLLYELLTGTTPLEMKRFKEAAWDEVKRIIREEDPPRPSTRLSSTSTLPSLAAGRQLEPARLTKLVRGELDWIVMKALEKDRSRRYESANVFSADVQRFLSGEQVQAVPPSAAYRLTKFARKNRAVLTTAAAFVGILITFAVVSNWLAVKAMRAEFEANSKRMEAEQNLRIAGEKSAEAAGYLLALKASAAEATESRNRLQVDLDLVELNNNHQLGLLQLCKTMRSLGPFAFESTEEVNPGVFQSQSETLRQFASTTVLTIGQEFAPLLPPITHDGIPVTHWQCSSTGSRLLTVGKDHSARLWDVHTAKLIAILQRSNEHVLHVGFSPDGETAFTDSLDGVVRLWETVDGAFRAETEVRSERITIDPAESEFDLRGTAHRWDDVVQISNQRVMTRGISVIPALFASGLGGPVELWDADTGKQVARLDAVSQKVDGFKLLNNGSWVASNADSTVVIFSAVDGKEVARLEHPGQSNCEAVDVSPSGRWLETSTTETSAEGESKFRLYFWDTKTWRKHPVEMNAPGSAKFVSDEYLQGEKLEDGFGGLPQFFCKLGNDEPIFQFNAYTSQLDLSGQSPLVMASIFTQTGATKVVIFDLLKKKQLSPPAGKAFHPDLARFSKNGRFLLSPLQDTLIDLSANKSLFLESKPNDQWFNLGEKGLLKLSLDPAGAIQVIVVPVNSNLEIPPEQLELWTQVAIRGQLNEQGEFVKWTEADWEKKRQELAAIPPPIKDFPFPGYVVTDKLHWLRAEYNEATDEAEKKRLAQELLRKAEENGDKFEAVRWRELLKPPPQTESK